MGYLQYTNVVQFHSPRPGMQVAGARLCCQAAAPGGSELHGGFDTSTSLGGREARGQTHWGNSREDVKDKPNFHHVFSMFSW